MGTYVKLMPAMVQRRMEELETKAAEAAKAAETVAPVESPAGALNSSDVPSTLITSNLATPPPAGLTLTSAAEQAGTVSPSLSRNEVATERAHMPPAEPPTVVPSKQASLDVTASLNRD